MKKIGVLNQPLSAVIAGLGHTDTLVVADAGLPIPAETLRLDLAVAAGIPSFMDVLRAVLEEMQVERIVLASEIAENNPDIQAEILALVGDVPVEYVPHEDFKAQTRAARAVVRTGECTPYANVILSAGVTF